MDIAIIRSKMMQWIKKYRFVAIILFFGIILMVIPTGTKNNNEPSPQSIEQEDTHLEITAEQLECLLTQIEGVGAVKVLLTCSGGERKVFLTDQRTSTADNTLSQENETVLISGSNRSEDAIVSQVVAPEYLGAVIVCKGADDPVVKMAVSDAVSKATGLGTNKISVLKMK